MFLFNKLMQREEVIIFIFAWFVRLAFSFPAILNCERSFTPDSYEYDQIAVNIVEHRSFSSEVSEPYLPNYKRTPMYPLFLAGIYSLFGHKPGIGLFIQTLLGALTCLVVYKMSMLVFTRKVSLTASALCSLDPLLVIYTGILLTETEFALFLILGMYFLVAYLKSFRTYQIILTAAWFGLCALCRPIALYFPFIIIVILLWRKSKILHAFLFLGCFACTLLPWIVRNYFHFNDFFISKITQVNLFYYEAAPLRASYENGMMIAALFHKKEALTTGANLLKQEMREKEGKLQNGIRFLDSAGSYGFHYIMRHPTRYMGMRTFGVAKILFTNGSLVELGRNLWKGGKITEEPTKSLKEIIPEIKDAILSRNFLKVFKTASSLRLLIEVLSILVYLFVIILIAISFYKKIKKGEETTFYIVFLMAILYFICIVGTYGGSRFRLPVEPYILILFSDALIRRTRNKEV